MYCVAFSNYQPLLFVDHRSLFFLPARQVEKIQHFTHLLADPNREAERGEVYLSQCFRHVSGTCFTFLQCVGLGSILKI